MENNLRFCSRKSVERKVFGATCLPFVSFNVGNVVFSGLETFSPALARLLAQIASRLFIAES